LTTAAKVVTEAASDLGMRESPPKSNVVPVTREFGKIPGYPHGGYGYPWCAAATSVWCRRVGLRPGIDYPHTASTIAQYNWAKSRSRWRRSPAVGDLVLYSTSGTSSGIYHVELVEKVSASSITTIGGNTSGSDEDGIQGNGDGCYRKTISRANARIYGYVRPRYSGAPDEREKPWDGRSYPGHLIRLGDRGTEVKTVQRMLQGLGWAGKADADFGPATEQAVKRFQTASGLEADGVVGKRTWARLAAGRTGGGHSAPAPSRPTANRTLKLGDEGADVEAIRGRLIRLGYTYLKPGSKWGPYMTVAVMDFQARQRLKVDGLADKDTRKALGL
jgi:peptidoglycan hydrolase-like protein with peptidoglycan-binding domain